MLHADSEQVCKTQHGVPLAPEELGLWAIIENGDSKIARLTKSYDLSDVRQSRAGGLYVLNVCVHFVLSRN